MGGPDADAALLPHFKSLKQAFVSGDGSLPCVGTDLIAFILRVDGKVHSFNFEGCERVDLNRRKKYISIDVGVPIVRWQGRSDAEIARYLVAVLPGGFEQMLARLRAEKIVCDEAAVRAMFEQGLARYAVHWQVDDGQRGSG